jgi:hypothetical protein
LPIGALRPTFEGMRTTAIQHKPAIYSLIRLHAELGGRIKDNARQAEKLAADMIHVEAVLRMLDPAFNARGIAAKRRNQGNPYFKKGACARHVMDVLREAKAPMTGREITVAVLHSFGVEEPTAEDVRRMYSAVHPSLKNHRGKTVRRVGEGMPARWELMR